MEDKAGSPLHNMAVSPSNFDGQILILFENEVVFRYVFFFKYFRLMVWRSFKEHSPSSYFRTGIFGTLSMLLWEFCATFFFVITIDQS